MKVREVIEKCKRCGTIVVMMCQKRTGYCSARCEDEARGKGWNG